MTFGDGPGFIEHHCIYLPCDFQAGGIFYQDSLFRSLAYSYNQCRRSGQSQCAGTGNYEYGNLCQQSVCEAFRRCKQYPDDKRQNRYSYNDRYKDSCDFIYQLLDRRFTSLRILYHADNLCQHRVRSCLIRPETKSSFLIDSTCIYLFAGLLVYRYRFTAQHTFIYVRFADCHCSVYCYAFSRLDGNDIADTGFFNRNSPFARFGDDSDGFRL